MSSQYENNSSGSTLLEELTRSNGAAAETMERTPYEMIVYAIPEQKRLAEEQFMENTVAYQEALLDCLSRLPTIQQQRNSIQLLTEKVEQAQRSVLASLQQAGSENGKSFSEIFKILSEQSKRLEALARKLLRTILFTAAGSVLLCGVLLLLLR